MKKNGGVSPTIREDIIGIQRTSDLMTDTERVMEYKIDDVIGTISAEFDRLIRITQTEFNNHMDLMKDPGNKEALLKALEHGVNQIQLKIKEMVGIE